MRLKILVSGMGECSMTRFPALPEADNIAALCGGDGRLSFAKCSAALGRDREFITSSSDDDLPTLALVVEFLRQLAAVAHYMVEDENRDLRHAPETKADKQVEKRMDRGDYCIVRIDINPKRGGTRARINVANPHDVKGTAPARAHDIALLCARILQEMRRQMESKGNHQYIPIWLEDGKGAPGLFALATKVERYDRLRDKRAKCCRRMNGIYCSPADFACPLYLEGKCTAPKSPTE